MASTPGLSSPTGLLPCFQCDEAVRTAEPRTQGCLESHGRSVRAKLPDLTGLTSASTS